MKYLILSVFVLFSMANFAQDQEPKNLIANPSFEQDNGKIKKLGEAGKALSNWSTATKTKVDVFSPSAVMPIASELVEHLEKDKRYCLSYNLSLADVSKYATNNFGVHFSKREIYEEDADALIKSDVILPSNNVVQKNMSTWTNVCVPFTAKGFEKFITIGNFHASNKTATENMKKPKGISQNQMPMGYYYIDNFNLVEIGRDSECTCAEEKLVEGPKIIYSKQSALKEGASIEQKVTSAAVYFYSLKTDLVKASNSELDKLAAVLNAKTTLKINIEGHSDSTEEERLKQEDDYVNISEQRAEAVKTYLLGKGVDEGQLSIVSHKASKPTSKMKTPISLAKNRRVLFTLK